MKFQAFKNFIKKQITGHEAGLNFFSQGGEDMILRSIFRKKIGRNEPGFYVDIGAFHPVTMSNTYFFYIAGWKGINIDPRPGCMEAFSKIRPKDINLEIGIGKKEETLSYYFISENSTMNSFSKEFLLKTGVFESVTKEIPVKVYPLSSVLEKYAGGFNTIDILNIDVEGLDMDVITSNDWTKYKPTVIVIELSCANLEDVIANKTAQYLCALGYRIVAKNVIVFGVASVFFVDNNFEY